MLAYSLKNIEEQFELRNKSIQIELKINKIKKMSCFFFIPI